MLKRLYASLRPADFRSSHALFDLPARGRPPRTLLIACSDLATNPFRLVPTNVQNLYVLQNFGNLASRPDELLTDVTEVEGAVALYRVEDIVICGHTRCDVMRALLPSGKFGHPKPLPAALAPAQKTRQILASHFGAFRGEQLLTEAARLNVLVQLQNLRSNASIAARLDRRELHLHGWLYAEGEISAYDPHRVKFLPLAQ